jgi:hypothetical protein
VSIVIAGVAPIVAAFGFLVSAVVAVMRARGDSGEPDPAAGRRVTPSG